MDKLLLDVIELKSEIINILEKEKHMVMATCADGRVTARTMSHINEGIDILFQTDGKFLKAEQIHKNPNVAVCIGNMQIEGTAIHSGKPVDPENAGFCEKYKQKHSHSFEMYAGVKTEIVFIVKPSFITLWKYINGKPCRDYFDVLKGMAYREYYEMESVL